LSLLEEPFIFLNSISIRIASPCLLLTTPNLNSWISHLANWQKLLFGSQYKSNELAIRLV